MGNSPANSLKRGSPEVYIECLVYRIYFQNSVPASRMMPIVWEDQRDITAFLFMEWHRGCLESDRDSSPELHLILEWGAWSLWAEGFSGLGFFWPTVLRRVAQMVWIDLWLWHNDSITETRTHPWEQLNLPQRQQVMGRRYRCIWNQK